MSERKRRSYWKGIWAEYLAALYLMFCGYKILARRYKTPVGEIDLVALKKDVVAIVEVKMRFHVADAMESVSRRSQHRIEKATQHFLARHPRFSAHIIRFDVVAVGQNFSFRYLDNVWQARS